MSRLWRSLAVAVSVLLTATGTALAHDEDGGLSPLDMGAYHHQHGENDGHLPGVQRHVEVVGQLDLFGDNDQPGKVSDVAAFGNHAYLGAFYEPDCEKGGVFVIDISNPAAPKEVGFIPVDPFTYVGEGVQVLDLKTVSFSGQVLVHNNENCIPVGGPVPAGVGGFSLWDVTSPTDPKPLALHVGDLDVQSPPHSIPHASHSAFGWQQGDRAYVVAVDNSELGTTDIDIFDITNPTLPVLVVETGLAEFPAAAVESPPPNGRNAFLHDMVVKKVGDRYLLLASYWDAGYVILDVTDLPNDPAFVGHTDFGASEPFAAQLGLPADTTPEGNAHQAEFNFKNDLFLGADEDFAPERIVVTMTSGAHAGGSFSATNGSDVPGIPDGGLASGTRYVGQACGAVTAVADADHRVALIERGTCTFQVKLETVKAAGYTAGIVFNDRRLPDCEAQVSMLAIGDIPFMFAPRSGGLRMLGQTFTDPCTTDAAPLAASASISIASIFDGWGYLHLFDARSMTALGHWALPEALDAAHSAGSGDLSIHEVAVDPRRNMAYLSHYAGGFRVVRFSRDDGIREVGAFIAPGGSNFWGVEVHYMPGSDEPFVLASDRDAGLWVFRYKPGAKP